MNSPSAHDSAVALVGMSGRFPGADSAEELWDNLTAGQAGLRPVTPEELAAAGVDPALTAHPRYVRVAAPVEDFDLFDASFFGFTPREAETTDPQHRLFLECSWEALESAGYPPNAVPGQVGVFAGCGFPNYMLARMAHLDADGGGTLRFAVGNERDSLASLVSYKLDLRGPSVTVQSFCSTSLVAVHLACQSLLTFECDTALAGGAFITPPQPTGYLFEEGGILSPDGVVRSFDAAAQGTVMGNGVGVVALKRMTDALAAGDNVIGLILGSAMNNDGRSRVGYTAPGVDGQADVIETALGVAGVDPRTIGYVECHATGTMLGDSIELAALNRAFAKADRERPCVLGSLKPSLGHLDRASGVAGLIRATMALRNRVLPRTPNFLTPNPALAEADGEFRVLTADEPWGDGEGPRRAGVNSFGLGGTNAHVVLEEPPEPAPGVPGHGPWLLALSARTKEALDAATHELRLHLQADPGLDLADVAFTLQMSRTGFPLRRAVVCRDHADAVAALSDPSRWITGQAEQVDPPVRVRVPATDGAAGAGWEALRRWMPGPETDGDVTGESLPAAAAIDALARVGVNAQALPGGEAPDEAGGAVTVLLTDTAQESRPEWFLRQLALLWQAGVRVEWTRLYEGQRRRVALPTYPFQRRRCWIEATEPPRTGQLPSHSRIPDPVDWTYLPGWRRRPLTALGARETLRAAGPWLVLSAEECGAALVRCLRDAGAEVTSVRPGTGFAEVSPGEFAVRTDSRSDHDRVLSAMGTPPRAVVHGFSLDRTAEEAGGGWQAEFEREQSRGFDSVLALVGALADRADQQPVDLLLLTEGAVGVTGADLTHPARAALAGLAPSLAQENPGLTCRHIDIDATAAVRRAATGRLASAVLAETVCAHTGPVALRDGNRFERVYETCRLPDSPSAEQPLPERATVLITGGLGDVGLIIARHLVSTRRCRLVLTARSPLPPREEWQERTARAVDDTDRTARHIRGILALEREGADVMAVSADVADPERMEQVVRASERRFGALDAVIHGAGVSDPRCFGTAHDMAREARDAHFRAKVYGFHALQQALPDTVRHRLTLSSLSAVLGGITLGPYAASNAALDAYALAARTQGQGDWITVDWDTWRTRADQHGDLGGSVADFDMAPHEAVGVLERVLPAASQLGRLVISTGPLEARLAQWVVGTADDEAGAADSAPDAPRHPRPPLATPYTRPAGEVEEALCQVWAETLGLDEVGTDDNFFELGGSSLVAMQLMSQVRKHLRASAPVTALLENPTIRELAPVLRRDKS